MGQTMRRILWIGAPSRQSVPPRSTNQHPYAKCVRVHSWNVTSLRSKSRRAGCVYITLFRRHSGVCLRAPPAAWCDCTPRALARHHITQNKIIPRLHQINFPFSVFRLCISLLRTPLRRFPPVPWICFAHVYFHWSIWICTPPTQNILSGVEFTPELFFIYPTISVCWIFWWNYAYLELQNNYIRVFLPIYLRCPDYDLLTSKWQRETIQSFLHDE